MEITYQPVLDKNYTKAVKKISRDIYMQKVILVFQKLN